VRAQYGFEQCALAATARANNRHNLTRRDLQVDVMQDAIGSKVMADIANL
jgi:hypothetical protein